MGLSVSPASVQKKLSSWEQYLDGEIIKLKESWSKGGDRKYQLIGDNWDKTILPSYRTTETKTLSLHLFNIYAVPDRIPKEVTYPDQDNRKLTPVNFIPSIVEQQQLQKELTFLVASSLIENVSLLNKEFIKIYPAHLQHPYSDYAGVKTTQVC